MCISINKFAFVRGQMDGGGSAVRPTQALARLTNCFCSQGHAKYELLFCLRFKHIRVQL